MDLYLEEPFTHSAGNLAARHSFASVPVAGGILYLFGAKTDDEPLKEMLFCDTDALLLKSYDYGGQAPPAVSGHAAAASPDDQVFLFGGQASSSAAEPFNSNLYQLSWNSKIWKRLLATNEGPSALLGHTMNFFHDRSQQPSLILIGGFRVSRASLRKYKELSDEIWTYDIQKNSWSLIKSIAKPSMLEPRSGHCACVVPETRNLLVFGGLTPNGASNEILLINLDSFSITPMKIEGKKPEPRLSCDSPSSTELLIGPGRNAAEPVSPKLFVLYGGTNGSQWFGAEGLWFFDLENNTWFSRSLKYGADALPLPTAGFCANIIDQDLFIFGGLRESNNNSNNNASTSLSFAFNAIPKYDNMATIKGALDKCLVASSRFVTIHLQQRTVVSAADSFPVRAPRLTVAERVDPIIAKLQEFNEQVARYADMDVRECTLVENELKVLRIALDCAINKAPFPGNIAGNTLDNMVCSILMLKLLLWPQEYLVPVLDLARNVILLEPVARKFAQVYEQTITENNILLFAVSAAYESPKSKSAPRIFALRFVANSFAHPSFHQVLQLTSNQLIEYVARVSFYADDERERQSLADVLLNYALIFRWRRGGQLKAFWLGQVITFLMLEIKTMKSETVAFTLLQAIGTVMERQDRSLATTLPALQKLLQAAIKTGSPKLSQVAEEISNCL